MVSFQRITLSFLLVSGALFAYLIPHRKDYLWNNKDIDPHEIRSMRESILNHFAIGESVIDKRRRLAKIVDIPYFGRIDFQEKSENCTVIPVYVLMRMIR